LFFPLYAWQQSVPIGGLQCRAHFPHWTLFHGIQIYDPSRQGVGNVYHRKMPVGNPYNALKIIINIKKIYFILFKLFKFNLLKNLTLFLL
jgi:hypothetical protein